MSTNFKEFSAKSIDAAIDEACTYYNIEREKLEIEIIEDAKSGIFGIVGVRKAKIKARRVSFAADKDEAEVKPQASESKNNKNDRNDKKKPQFKKENQEKHEVKTVEKAKEAKPIEKIKEVKKEEVKKEIKKEEIKREDKKHKDNKANPKHASEKKPTNFEEDSAEDSSLTKISLLELDQDKLISTADNYFSAILKEVSPELEYNITVKEDKLIIQIDSEDAGEFSGKSGQNIYAIQYILSLMLTKAMQAYVRVNFDSGDYKERQEAALTEMAKNLASKVRANGKSLSTRPLSSYHRRIIHMALQTEDDLGTKSIGDGTLKKVIIFRKRKNG